MDYWKRGFDPERANSSGVCQDAGTYRQQIQQNSNDWLKYAWDQATTKDSFGRRAIKGIAGKFNPKTSGDEAQENKNKRVEETLK